MIQEPIGNKLGHIYKMKQIKKYRNKEIKKYRNKEIQKYRNTEIYYLVYLLLKKLLLSNGK